MHRRPHLHWLTALLIGAMFILSACQESTPPATPTMPPAQAVETVAPSATALPAATATLSVAAPTATLPPTLPPTLKPEQPTEVRPAITPLPGMALFTHPLIQNHIFQAD